VKVAYFGRQGSYAHQMAVRRFGPSAKYNSCPTHRDVLEALLKRRAQAGVLPLENSVAGVVMETIDVLVSPEFVESRLKVREHLDLVPDLALLSKTPWKQIRRIYSHPYPLRYLARWIRAQFPQADVFETVSTSEAAQLAAEQVGTAAIAGPHAAKIYQLKVLKKGLAKPKEYLTRFCVVSSKPLKSKRPTHTTLCFGLKHRPGALVGALSIFAEHGLNMTRIISRPLFNRTGKFKPDAYLFWVDIDGAGSKNFESAMKALRKKTTFLDLIGAYFVS
jgi:chorismate mutase / prephenate dehydratase